jgi:membrane-associated HD superfamily phosphohydrolase
MKKVIRLTESDLVRLVKRVISEQVDDGLFSEDEKYMLKQNIESLHDQISMVRKENFEEKREQIKKTLTSMKNKLKSLINLTINKVKGKIDEKQLNNLKRRADLLNKKLEELETTGKVFTKEEKRMILSEMIAILGLIVGLPILSKLNLPKVPTLPMP